MNESSEPQKDLAACRGPWWFTELFKCFRIAIHPSKMLPALLTVIALFVAGLLMDLLGAGNEVVPDEFNMYLQTEGGERFDTWREGHLDAEAAAGRLEDFLIHKVGLDRTTVEPIVADAKPRWSDARKAIVQHFKDELAGLPERYEDAAALTREQDTVRQRRSLMLDDFDRKQLPQGVFQTTFKLKLAAFQEFVTALINPAWVTDPSILLKPIGKLAAIPGWLWRAHPGFLIIWALVFIAIWGLLGGALSRSTMVEVATGEKIAFGQAASFAAKRWLSYVAAPLMPLVVIGVGWVVLAVCGLVFHVPVLDVIGALLFFVALLLGFGLALLLIFWAFGIHLMYPVLSAEGSDAFDAMARSFSYLAARPWKFIWYSLVSLVYGALTYLFVGVVVYLTLQLTQAAVATWCGGFDEMMPSPDIGSLCYWPRFDSIDGVTGDVAAIIVAVFANAVVALVGAYAISYYFASTNTIYLLLRRGVDGIEPTQCYIEPSIGGPDATEEKVEPTEATAATETVGDADSQ